MKIVRRYRKIKRTARRTGIVAILLAAIGLGA